MEQFWQILHPMQVVDVTVTSPLSGFRRFSWVPNLIIFVVGGDKMVGYIMKSFNMVRDKLQANPIFRFIPLGPYAEIGRSFGGRIKYSKKSADYLIKQLPRLKVYDFISWKITENTTQDKTPLSESFMFTFALGMETYKEPEKDEPETNSFHLRIWKKIAPESYERNKRSNMIRRWGEGPEPVISEDLELEIDGKRVDLSQERFVAIVFRNCITREDDLPRGRDLIEITNGLVDVIGLTEYCKLTRQNLDRQGIILGQSANINVTIKKIIPYQSDAFSSTIRWLIMGDWRNMVFISQSPIQVLAVPGNYSLCDQWLTSKGTREDEDKPLDVSECFLDSLEQLLQIHEMDGTEDLWSNMDDLQSELTKAISALATDQEGDQNEEGEMAVESTRAMVEMEMKKMCAEVEKIRAAEKDAARRVDEYDSEEQFLRERQAARREEEVMNSRIMRMKSILNAIDKAQKEAVKFRFQLKAAREAKQREQQEHPIRGKRRPKA